MKMKKIPIIGAIPPLKSFVQHSGWQEMVSLCSLIRLIGVCADRDQPEFLCSRSDSRYLEVHVATAGGWLTRYRPHEVRNSIYRYRKIHIDYRSKFLYRFISSISIIYGNTSNFQTDSSDWWLRYLLWNYPNMNVTGLHWWSVNIGSGNGLVPSGTKPLPEPMLTQICRHMASLGQNE